MSSLMGATDRLSSPTLRPWLGQRSGAESWNCVRWRGMYNVRITVVPRATSEQVFTIKPAQKQRLVVLLFSPVITLTPCFPRTARPSPSK